MSIRKQIITNLKTALEGISTPGYNNTIRHVYLYNTSIDKVKELPSIVIAGNMETKQFGPTDYYSCRLRVFLDAAIIEGDREEKHSAALDLLQDLEECVMQDYTRGGLATDTRIVNSFVVPIGDSENNKIGVRLVIEINYRHRVSDPSQ